MDVFSNFGLWGGGFTGWIIPFLFGLSVVVFFHELGHFLVARWCGVRVLTFSVGFGPELVGFTDRHGTRWKIAAPRHSNTAARRPSSFPAETRWRRRT